MKKRRKKSIMIYTPRKKDLIMIEKNAISTESNTLFESNDAFGNVNIKLISPDYMINQSLLSSS